MMKKILSKIIFLEKIKMEDRIKKLEEVVKEITFTLEDIFDNVSWKEQESRFQVGQSLFRLKELSNAIGSLVQDHA